MILITFIFQIAYCMAHVIDKLPNPENIDSVQFLVSPSSSFLSGYGYKKKSWYNYETSTPLAIGTKTLPRSLAYDFTIPIGQKRDGHMTMQDSVDEKGNMSGNYSIHDPDGRSRKVSWSADNQGFKAKVETNEPGTKSENPADVIIKSTYRSGHAKISGKLTFF